MTNTPPTFIKKIGSLVEINNLQSTIVPLPKVEDQEYNDWSMKVYDSMKLVQPDFVEV